MTRFSLKTKIILSIVLVLLIAGSVESSLVYRETENDLMNLKKSDLSLYTSNQAEKIDQYFLTSQSIINEISELTEIKNYVSSEPKIQDPEILSTLKKFNFNQMYSAIHIVDSSGRILVSTDPNFNEAEQVDFRSIFKKSFQGSKEIEYLGGLITKKYGFYFTCPIVANRNISGIIVFKLNPDYIYNDLLTKNDNMQIVSGPSRFMMVDDNGIIIHSDNTSYELKSLSSLSQNELEKIKSQKKYENDKITQLAPGFEKLRIAMDSLYQFQAFEFYNNLSHENEIVSVGKITSAPFYLVSENDLTEIKKPLFRISITTSIALFGLVVVSAIVITLIIMRILKPLEQLHQATIEIGTGNLLNKIDIDSGDEFQHLGEALNNMAEQSSKLRDNFEQKIIERTAELEKINKYMSDRELKMIELKKEINDLKRRLYGNK